MMKIEEIYKKFDEIGCLTFATIDGDCPETRIAHLFAYDEDGLYLRTMTVKPMYKQMKDTGKLSICGMSASPHVEHGENGLPNFEAGYTMRASGDVKEISFEELQEKAKKNSLFELGVKDILRYPDIVTLCLYKFQGEYYDYDFDCVSRDHKIVRERFTYGGYQDRFKGLKINQEKCISCGKCYEKCQEYNFKAVERSGNTYQINNGKCDVCANCTIVCPSQAIEAYY